MMSNFENYKNVEKMGVVEKKVYHQMSSMNSEKKYCCPLNGGLSDRHSDRQ